MFTGIVQAVGHVARLEPRGGDLRLHIEAGGLDLDDVRLGDSIAVSGVCLTAVALAGRGFAADVSNETLALTTLGDSPLRLSGSGQWVGSRLRFSGVAEAAPEHEAQLTNLLTLIGRRSGTRSIITVG